VRVAVDALVADLWDVGRMDEAREIAQKHIEAAIAHGRDVALADVERIVQGVAQTSPDVQVRVILTGIRDLRGIGGGNGGLA
jgi:hypothetical protein